MKEKLNEPIGAEEIISILKTEDKKTLDDLADLASKIRAKFLGRQVCIHGIVEFSSFCRRNCLYCGLRRDNGGLSRYRLEPDNIAETAIMAVKKLGYKMLVLQSGEDLYYSTDKIVYILKKIFNVCRPLIFLSIGESDFVSYGKFFAAGARGVLFRFETSSKKLYEKMHPGASFEERINHLKFFKELGYIIATGPLIGLPGQSLESHAADLILIRELGVHMVSMGPFIPSFQTPLSDYKSVSPFFMRKIIIAARLALPALRLPITTAMEYLWGDNFRRLALCSGANSFMLNLTPTEVRDAYDIYPDKNKLTNHLHSEKAIFKIKKIVKECGLEVCRGFGKDFEQALSGLADSCGMER